MNTVARNFPLVCVTGPMAAGKNLVADIFSAKGYACVDADKIAHVALQQLKVDIIKLHSQSAKKLGLNLENSDGSLNRKAIGQIVFSDSKALIAHEELVHPFTEKLLNEFIDQHSGQPVVINATVLYKLPNLLNKCSCVVYVKAPVFVRFFRAIKRDKMPFRQIILRFYSQKNIFAKYKKSNADIYRVWNIGTPYTLERKIERMLLVWNKKELYGLSQQ